ncbi:Beta-1-3-galactosyltransferase [Brachionus plicatilis]|uniref:Hexosyltransferase n=1 Tax=Brachionus plicatilis TaxID=10195 RepID=A0A3M7QZ71_BRAPC|nr:Beta-1-3-galactosyltransferase [Brachionus plicatilis]
MRIRFFIFYLIGIIVWALFTLFISKVNYETDNKSIDDLYDEFKPDLLSQDNPHNFRYLINPGPSICSTNLVLIAFVCISPASFEHRNLIRQTWANWKLFPSIRAVFLVGLSSNKTLNSMLITESETYGDIVQEDFMDTYDNLTLKTVMGLKWVSTYCSNSKFTLKVDDDVVVNVPVLIKFLKNQINFGKDKNYYMGSLQQNAIILRDKKSKWFIKEEELNGKYYPSYHQGPAYMFSTDLAAKLYQTSLNTQFFRFEDIYLGVLANRAVLNQFRKINYLVLIPFGPYKYSNVPSSDVDRSKFWIMILKVIEMILVWIIDRIMI